MDAPAAKGSAIISECGLYRYRLERRTSVGPCGRVAAVIMANPSTADADTDDATIRKGLGFAERNDIGQLIVGNKFAFRATDIKASRTAPDPVGPENDRHLEAIMREDDFHLVAWGPLSKLPPNLRTRWRAVARIAERVGCRLHALATAQCGHPKHRLMLSYHCMPAPWVSAPPFPLNEEEARW
ncbi:hypothetical protein GGR33_005127 [Methylobacterium brachythecii]|uniref:DUF1643 domain-containing protein n=1 Tax=Methylobacterium brachythecii TaxID=1176177 RepID=A0A7W6F9J3_9HYPH|nr:hypothetical protein [Methylobacterium brachythecii]